MKKWHDNFDVNLNSYKKRMNRVMIDLFTIKFLTGDTILKPRTKVASGNKTEIQIFRKQKPCPRILKLISRNK